MVQLYQQELNVKCSHDIASNLSCYWTISGKIIGKRRKARQNLIGQKILQWFRNTMKCRPGLCSGQREDICKLGFVCSSSLARSHTWVNILPRNPYNAISTFFENLIFLTTPAPLFSGKCNKKPNTRPFFERF